jgi:DNA-binding transcriptional regulator YiaG
MKPAPKTPSKSKMYEYDRMEAHELKAALEQLNLSTVYFAKISGSNPRKVDEWLAGQVDIPHHILVLLTVFATVPGALKAAHDITNQVVHFWAENAPDA